MKISYSEVWNDTLRMLQANVAILVALAGVFYFLPDLLVGFLLPVPEQAEPNEAVRLLQEYMWQNWPWILLAQLVKSIGSVTMLLLLLKPRGTTVAGLIAASLPLVPSYFLVTILSLPIIVIGLILLIAPGVYLIGRLAMIGPVIAFEQQRNPLTAVTRSFALTEGKGWAVAGLLVLVGVAAVVAARVSIWLLGIPFLLLAGRDVGALLVLIVQSLASAAISTLFVVLIAALYRRLSGAVSLTKAD